MPVRPPAQPGRRAPTDAELRRFQLQRTMQALMRPKARTPAFPERRYRAGRTQAISLQRRLSKQGLPREARTGLVIADPNPDLHPYLARGLKEELGVYTEMARSEPIIAGILGLISREIARAEWTVEAPASPTPAEEEAYSLAVKFFGLDGSASMLRGGLARHLALAAWDLMAFGFRSFERVWTSHEWQGRTILAPSQIYAIPGSSVWGWIWSASDRQLIAMMQTAPSVVTEGSIGLYSGLTIPVSGSILGENVIVLPMSRLVHYMYQGDVDQNPEGLALSRAAWVWWQAKKDTILRYQEGQERLFDGLMTISEIPHPATGNAYDSDSAEDLTMFDESMQLWTDGLLRYLFMPLGYQLKSENPAFSVPSPEDVLQYYDRQIAATFGAQLIGQPSPTAAMTAASAKLTFSAIDSIARGLADTLNGQTGIPSTGLIRDLVDTNIEGAAQDPGFRYPKLKPIGIHLQDIQETIDALTKASQFRLLEYSPSVESMLRRMTDAPPLTPDEIELRQRWAAARLENEIVTGGITTPLTTRDEEDEQDRQSEVGIQAPVEPPDQIPAQNPDGV